ncbi:hypothetical protein C2G38_2167093 [Gigaspora rosea]|uniref:Uncharacterized protein n=1 Tax=Gigaspora rosea TaxID=44941 RepID=A0A397VR62_9GLOM|nr:hypothetical protein C2G38_2167093 [Gigaspora rosea]
MNRVPGKHQGKVVKNNSFYTSLNTEFIVTIQEYSQAEPYDMHLLESLNHKQGNADPTYIKSGAMIYIQVESTKYHKSKSSSTRRKLHTKARTSKENLDPQTIPIRKKGAQ